MRHRVVVLGFAVVAGLIARVREASACSCAREGQFSPAPGAEDVPTNVELFRNANGSGAVTLVGGGEAVDVFLEQQTCGGYRYVQQLALQPNTSYEVFNYQTSDLLTWFTTGDGPDQDVPAPPVITELWFGVDGGNDGDSCGDHTQIDFTVEAAGATTLRLTRETSLGGCEMILFPGETGDFGSPLRRALPRLHRARRGRGVLLGGPRARPRGQRERARAPVRDGAGLPVELWHLEPDRLRPPAGRRLRRG